MSAGSPSPSDLRPLLATACRVMADRLLVEDILGHISARLDDDHLLVRCRGQAERGLSFTEPDDIRTVELATGRIVDDPDGGYAPPNELPIHTSVLSARPDVVSVVHAHPPEVVVASMAGVALTPIFGAYDIPAARLAAASIPTFERGILINDDAVASEMVAGLGDADAIVLRGHGLVTAGSSVPAAVLVALQVDRLARMHLAVRRAGVTPTDLPADDLAALPDLGPGFNEATMWRHLTARLGQTDLDRTSR